MWIFRNVKMGETKEPKTPDTNQADMTREYRIGTQFITALGAKWQYGKVDFGIIGKTNDGKVLRDIRYMWFPRNVKALERGSPFVLL